MGRVSRKHRARLLDLTNNPWTTLPNWPARGAEWGPFTQRKETPAKQAPKKSCKCRGIKQLTVEPSGTDEEGAWPNISWLFWKRVPDPKPTGISTELCGLLQFFTLIQNCYLCFFALSSLGTKIAMTSFDFKYFPFTVPAGMGGSMQGEE